MMGEFLNLMSISMDYNEKKELRISKFLNLVSISSFTIFEHESKA